MGLSLLEIRDIHANSFNGEKNEFGKSRARLRSSLRDDTGLGCAMLTERGLIPREKIKKKISYNIFSFVAPFSRKATLKFLHLCERFSCLFLYRGCLRDNQYKLFLLIIIYFMPYFYFLSQYYDTVY